MPQILGPIIAAAGVTGTIEIAGTSIAVSTVVADVAISAALVGAQYLFANRSMHNEPLRASLKQSTSPRYQHFGRVRFGGVPHFYESNGAYLGMGQVLSEGGLDAVETLIVDDEVVTLTDGLINVGRKKGFGQIEVAAASPTGNPSPLISGAFPDIWGADNKCVDLSCIYGLFYYGSAKSHQSAYPSGFPRIEVILRGVDPHDPRSGLDAWTDNPALNAGFYLTSPNGGRKSSDWIDWPSFGEAADACEAQVAKYGGGTEAFATCAGTFQFNEPARDVLAKLMAACDGSYYETPQGLIGMRVAAYVEPTVTLTDDDVTYVKVEYTDGALAEFNKVYAKFLDPARNYQMNDACPVFDEDAMAIDGEKATNVTLDYVNRSSQAYRIINRMLRRLVGKRRVTLRGGVRFMLLIGEQTCRLDLAMANVSGVFDVLSLPMPGDLAGEWSVTLRETGADVFEDAVPPLDPEPPLSLAAVADVADPASVSVSVIVVGAQNLLQLTCTAPPADFTLSAQYREVDGLGAPISDWMDYPAAVSSNIVQSGPVGAGHWESQCWIVSPGGTRSDPPVNAGITDI